MFNLSAFAVRLIVNLKMDFSCRSSHHRAQPADVLLSNLLSTVGEPALVHLSRMQRLLSSDSPRSLCTTFLRASAAASTEPVANVPN